MPPPTPFLNPSNPLHLYRHLLREASYLPPIAAPYITSRIQARFRRWRSDPSPSRRLRQAAGYTRFLFAANAGNLTSMRRVLCLALGRDGRRRRELMIELRRKEPPSNTAELLTALNTASTLEEKMLTLEKEEEDKAGRKARKERNGDWLDKWDTEKILTFAKSQGMQNKTIQGLARSEVQSNKLKPEDAVPELNSWGRPFPAKTARSKTRKWWKMLAHRLVPPMPKGEWDILAKLAEGSAGPEWDAPPRRYAIAVEQPPKEVYGLEDAATKPVRMLERHNARNFKFVMGTETEAEAAQPWSRPALGVHVYTPRAWKRLYTSIWRMSSVMQNKQDRLGWDIEWGASEPPEVTAASSIHDGFFRNAEATMPKGTSGGGRGGRSGEVATAVG